LLQAPHEAPDKASRVRSMFNAIAPRYELVNSLCSGGRDAAWRRKTIRLSGVTPDDDVLDIATGTGDLARAFAKAGPRSIVGTDFAHEMLSRARLDASGGVDRWCEADALKLPFRDQSFSITSCAFGVRNFRDLDVGLSEMHRVLRPGGRAVILEFTRPTNALARGFYEVYSNRLMPVVASWVSGDKSGAYRYLPKSVVSFLDAAQMCERLRAVGFHEATATPLTMGVVTVYVATKSV
jgi:demethylmenaquinone methyltransferase/2-methoxy-6-polyprenyl-1,4-benzoquinol methylase